MQRQRRRTNAYGEEIAPRAKFHITTAGGIRLHKSTVSFGNALMAVEEQAKAGRRIWVREVAGAPSYIMELNHNGMLHVYRYGGLDVLPLRPEEVPAWAREIHRRYVDNYPGGIARG